MTPENQRQQQRQMGSQLIKELVLGAMPKDGNPGGIRVLSTAPTGVTNTFAAKLLVTVGEAFSDIPPSKKPALSMKLIPVDTVLQVSDSEDNHARLSSGARTRQVAALQHFLINGEDEPEDYASEFTVLSPVTTPFQALSDLADVQKIINTGGVKGRQWTPLQLERLLSSERDIDSFLMPKKEGESPEDIHSSIIAFSRRVYDDLSVAGLLVQDLATIYRWPEEVARQAPMAIKNNFVDACSALMVIRVAGRTEGLNFIQSTLMNKVTSGETTKFAHMAGSNNTNHPLERIVAVLNTRGPAAEHDLFRRMTPSKLIEAAMEYAVEGFCMTAWNHPINKLDAASPLSFFRQSTHAHVMEAKEQMVGIVKHCAINKKPLSTLADSPANSLNIMHQITSLQAKHNAIMNTTEKENVVESVVENIISPSVRVAANPGRKTKMM